MYTFNSPIYVFTHLFIHPFIHISIHLSIHLFIHLSIYLSIHLFIHPSIYLSTIYLSIYLSIHRFIIYCSIHLFIHSCILSFIYWNIKLIFCSDLLTRFDTFFQIWANNSRIKEIVLRFFIYLRSYIQFESYKRKC